MLDINKLYLEFNALIEKVNAESFDRWLEFDNLRLLESELK